MWRSSLHRGIAALDALMPDLVRFERATGAPAPVSAGWVRAAAVAGRGEPWVVVLRSRAQEIIGTATLVHTGMTIARPAAEAPASPFRVAVGAASALAKCIVDHVVESGRRLDITGLPADDPVAGTVAELAPAGRYEPAALVRGVDLGACTAALSASARRALAAASERVRRDGVDLRVVATTHPRLVRPAIAAALPRDDRFWHDALAGHVAHAEVELTTLTLDGAVAAQALGLLDAPTYRVLGGHAEPRFSAYAPAQQIGASLVVLAAADPRYRRVEWAPSSALGPPDPLCPTVRTWRLIAGVTPPAPR